MNKIEINIPEGFEVDLEKSNISKGIIEFKPVKKVITYNDVAKELLKGKPSYFLGSDAMPHSTVSENLYADGNRSTSFKQLECLVAYNKLRNVAEYLNKEPLDWKNDRTSKYHLCYSHRTGNVKSLSAEFTTTANQYLQAGCVYFATEKLAMQALEILGEEEVKKALFVY